MTEKKLKSQPSSLRVGAPNESAPQIQPDDSPESSSAVGESLGEESSPKRGRGRPSKGEPVLVRLSPSERAVAEALGSGVVAEGIRIALIASGRMGEQAVRLLALNDLPPKVD